MKKIISYILLIFWIFIIFYLSNQTGNISGNNSSSIIYALFDFIYNLFNLDKTNLNNLVNILDEPLRELMHSFEYLILGLLITNLLKQYKIKTNILIPILLCFIYASTDEIHQLFVPGRSFQYFDILMDMIGSIIGVLLLNLEMFKHKEYTINYRRQLKWQKKEN